MVGPLDDRMLALSETNCPNYKAAQDTLRASDDFKTMVAGQADFFAALETLTGEKNVSFNTGIEICEYLLAADLHNKVLKFTPEQATLDSCQKLVDSGLYLTATGNDLLW
jgi:hypothetical protein